MSFSLSRCGSRYLRGTLYQLVAHAEAIYQKDQGATYTYMYITKLQT